MSRWVSLCLLWLASVGFGAARPASAEDTASEFFAAYCTDCHGGDAPEGELALDTTSAFDEVANWRSLERVVRRLQVRQMPPLSADRPSDAEYQQAIARLSAKLDVVAEKRQPTSSPTLRRLTRLEYQNAVRDLLHLEIDATQWLPADESSGGFDNITVGELSPLLLNRYVTAAQAISRLALGNIKGVQGRTIRIRPDLTQEQRVAGLPFGTRGGAKIDHYFPQTGDYEFTIRLARDRNEEVEGLRGKHDVLVLLDRNLKKQFEIRRPKNKNFSKVDQHLTFRTRVEAGPHQLGVTFARTPELLEETKRQPYQAHFNMHRHPRLTPAIFQVSITGPFQPQGNGETPSRERLLTTDRSAARLANERERAASIMKRLMRNAYRRTVSRKDLTRSMAFYDERRSSGEFDDAIQAAVASVLVSPHFLFRIERPATDASDEGEDFELASRLSFFLWSSIPDEELLDLAEAGRLRDPKVLRNQVARMLADSRSQALATNFADQWLQLRNLSSAEPSFRRFPDFDENLRRAFRTETQMLLMEVVRKDLSILQLLRSDFTFLNERLAKHYGIPHIVGPDFRRVALKAESHRGGVLRHGSVLTVSSYATRTSPVLRGKWILENILGAPTPPPPDDVPALEENSVAAGLSVRERLAAHRANPACASCHDLIDPIGFALENYDAVGRYREFVDGVPVDTTGELFDGSKAKGVDDLEAALISRPEAFATALAEKLLMFAAGRQVDEADAAEIRVVVRRAAAENYRFSELVQGVVASRAFNHRRRHHAEASKAR